MRERCGRRTGSHQQSLLSSSPMFLRLFSPLWCSQIIKNNKKKIVGVGIGVVGALWFEVRPKPLQLLQPQLWLLRDCNHIIAPIVISPIAS